MTSDAQIPATSKPEKILLWNNKAPVGDGTFQEADATITVHRPAKPNGTAIIICPGGGYGMRVSGPEGHQIAEWLNGSGITGVVLDYRLPKGKNLVPLLDAQEALTYTRAHAKEWGLDPSRIGIMGFSAGGHLAASAAVHPDPVGVGVMEKPLHLRPDFAVLIYPVISFEKMAHAGSMKNLMGENPEEKTIHFHSTETQVTDKSPPTFLAHAVDDKTVPIEHSRLFAEALKGHGVPVELVELPNGGHGLSGYKGESWERWKAKLLAWLDQMGFMGKSSASG